MSIPSPAGDSLKSKCLECGADIAPTAKFCPECGASTMSACSTCGVPVPRTAKFCPECGAVQSPQQETQATNETNSALKAYGQLSSRYHDIYQIADGMVRLGKIIKIVAVVVAVTGVIAAIVIASNGGFGSDFASPAVVVVGLCAGVGIFCLGILIGACGELLRALVDTSVNTSPLITDSEKATIIGLL